jgi:sulfate/thiosulfate transport system ATP-binding protein
MTTIDIKNVTKRFDRFSALSDISLNIKQGELVALLGPSGSGKTTLLRIIAGLDVPDSGEVWMDGARADDRHLKERQVGFVFQHYALFKHMTVFNNVAFGLKVRPKQSRPSDAEIRERVMNLLKLVHLDQFEDRYPSQLSGGQRQRVALARALAVEPKLLLLDEPFGALDAKVRMELRRWLRRLHDEIHITTLFVTHDQEEAMEVADRVVVMNQGRIEQVGTPEEVYHRPSNGFVYDFLGNYNAFAGWRDEDGTIHLADDDVIDAAPSTSRPALSNVRGLVERMKKLLPQRFMADIPSYKPTPAPSPENKYPSGVPVTVYTRPHEMYIATSNDKDADYIPVSVLHINPAGALVKLELQRRSGAIIQAEVSKNIVDQLALKKGDALLVRPKHMRVFA